MYFNYMMYSNPYYILGTVLVLMGSVFMMYAQFRVKSSYERYKKVQCKSGMSGHDIARKILDDNYLSDVRVNEVKGVMSDHYNPSTRAVNLSSEVYRGTSIAAVAIASHECGHAIQHKEGYVPLKIRSTILPFCNIGQQLGWVAVMIGLLTSALDIAIIGVVLMSSILVFQIVTLPVEFNASSRAFKLVSDRFISNDESTGFKSMLGAAALTYVAAMLATLLSLLRIVLLIVGRNRND